MPLPECACVAGQPTQQQLGAIYCALLEVIAGQGGGEITLSQISDLDTSWITPLQAPVGNFSVTLSQISNMPPAWQNFLATTPPDNGYLVVSATDLTWLIDTSGQNAFPTFDDLGIPGHLTFEQVPAVLAGGNAVFTGTAGGTALTQGTAVNGILTDLQGV